MKKYVISFPFKDVSFLGSDEINIESDDLIYSEVDNFNSAQCANQDNKQEIITKCKQIADFIREIEQLNN